jgi:hypothetical protein
MMVGLNDQEPPAVAAAALRCSMQTNRQLKNRREYPQILGVKCSEQHDQIAFATIRSAPNRTVH